MASSNDWQEVSPDMRLDSGSSSLEKTGVYGRPNLDDTSHGVRHDPNGDTMAISHVPGVGFVKNRQLHAVLVQLDGPRQYDLVKIDQHHMTLGRGSVGFDPEKTGVYSKPNFSAAVNPDIAIDDGWVSNPHCKFHTERDEDGVVQDMLVEDMESENGTWVNGKMVKKAVLKDRDVITVGETKLLFLRI